MKNYRVIVSGGGTGGHIFPAVAIANAIKEKFNSTEFLFVGAKGKMEMEKVPTAGYKIEGLWISGLQRKLTLDNLLLPLKIISSFFKARTIIKTFKPDIVIGTGGYASWAIMKAANSAGVPTLIQEQNSFPGKSNLDLATKAEKICVAYDGMDKFFPKEKIMLTGNPVRQDIQNLNGKRERGLENFKLNANKKTVLVIGGSLGARTINESIEFLLPEINKNNIQLVWQTGKAYFEKAINASKPYNENVKVFDFIKTMDLAYACADIVISRAGAISISEICLTHKPSILIPSPNVAEDHQTKNAMALVNHQAALMVKDAEAKIELGKVLFELINNTEQQYKLTVNLSKLAFPNAAETIAGIAISIMNR
jgi:UDP-N-acetylglucosamine--N-acetylmuramyl-(pentapeptide) pyrophosphoryl-undecaprenol N-acetylglucosamine transferase